MATRYIRAKRSADVALDTLNKFPDDIIIIQPTHIILPWGKQSNDKFSQGAHCILTKTMLKYEQIIEKTKKEFNAVKKEDESNSDDNYTDSDSDDSSDSDFEI